MSKLTDTVLHSYEAALARLILATVVEVTPALGRPPTAPVVSAVLRGVHSPAVKRADLHRVATFGALAGTPASVFGRWLHELAANGLVEAVNMVTVEAKGARLMLTAGGRGLVEGGTPDALRLVPGAVPPEALDLATRAGLVDALRRHRIAALGEHVVRQVAANLPANAFDLADLGVVLPLTDAAEVIALVKEHGPVIERLRHAQAARR